MTKKDYEQIAAAFRRKRAKFFPDRHANADRLFAELVVELADICEADNPHFNRDKFFKACYTTHRRYFR